MASENWWEQSRVIECESLSGLSVSDENGTGTSKEWELSADRLGTLGRRKKTQRRPFSETLEKKVEPKINISWDQWQRC
jgi:hypothetical protein